MPDRIAPREVVLSVERVTVHFGGLVALSDLNFTVRDGEIVGLIGPNGAGKTTAFNVFTGYSRPTHGEVRYRGTLLNGLETHQIADLGLVRTFQRTSIFQSNSVIENVLTGLHRRGRASVLETLLAMPRERAEERELADKAMKSCVWWASSRGRRSSPVPFPTENSACSVSLWRLPRSPPCCCSTSRYPG